jgi:hypothetical protein
MENEIVKTSANDITGLDAETMALITQAAQTQGEEETSSIPFLSVKGKKFTLGEEKLGNIINVVILADIFDHAYYDRPYDPDVISPPACFAINTSNSDLAPSNTSPTPQAENCNVCPMNEFGSSQNGKGKACRNGRRLLIAATTNGVPDLNNLAIINLAPTSLKAYARYAKGLATVKKLPIWAVITTLSFDDDSTWPQIVPTFNGVLDGQYINSIAPMLPEMINAVSVPYDISGYVPMEASTTKKSKMS